MNSKTERIIKGISILIILMLLVPQNLINAEAATHAAVYKFSPMLEDAGNIYYVQRVEGDEYSYDIYRLEIATGNKTKLVTSQNDILTMLIEGETLYYTCYEGEKDIYQTYSASIDGKEVKTVCEGYLVYLDDSNVYYMDMGKKNRLYKKAQDSQKPDLLHTGNMTFRYVKNLENTMYFSQVNNTSSKLTIYTLEPEQTKLSVLTTEKLSQNGEGIIDPLVSDIIKINGDIFYQYGSREGSGSYWYGALKKLASDTGKKATIAAQLYEEKIYHYDSSIFYNGTESSEKRYRYNTKTGKTSEYQYKIIGTETFNILGDKTYVAKADGKDLITVSRFTSGTNQKKLVKSFISIAHKQNKKYDYYAEVKQYGAYLLIPVTCMDFNDTSHSWRGRLASMTWYVTDMEGKLLTQFE